MTPHILLHHSNTSTDIYAMKSLAFSVLLSLSHIFNVAEYKYNLIDTSCCKVLTHIKFSNYKASR